jgi:D-alanyl-D-alanine endopeptidase (penicillin-binding protein 7)
MRKFLIFYIALMLSVSPFVTHAASKKAHKHSVSTSKHKYVQKKSGKMRVNYRLRNSKAARIYADSYNGSSPLKLASAKALVINQATGETVFGKNTSQMTPIASVTKLMTAMVMLDAHLPMDEILIITNEDVDYLKGTTSRLSIGTALSRSELLQLALIASENRAASALGRNYPGGIIAFVRAMNRKAESLGMKSTHFVDSSGLDSNNVSTAEDLAKMVNAAYHYPQIREISTTAKQAITPFNRDRSINVVNTNSLVRGSNWMIGLSKTGFINEAGRCLVMQAEISGQPMIIVLLDSVGKQSRIGDANRIRKWVEYNDANSLGEKVSG